MENTRRISAGFISQSPKDESDDTIYVSIDMSLTDTIIDLHSNQPFAYKKEPKDSLKIKDSAGNYKAIVDVIDELLIENKGKLDTIRLLEEGGKMSYKLSKIEDLLKG